MIETNRSKKVKIAVDVVSALAVIVLLIVPGWCVFDPNFHSHGVPGAKRPIQLKVMMTDAIPFVFGSIWLICRYGMVASRKYPFILTLRFRLLMCAAALATGTYLSIVLKAK